MNVSAIVITKNEAESIARCLASLAWAHEIIVVDAESDDNTAAIATAAGARVFSRPWPGYGAQKNFGATQAAGEWLLFIDADEVVTPALQRAIQQTVAAPTVDFYWLRIVTVFLGRPLSHLFGHNPRLFRKSSGQWNTARVHEQVERADGSPIRLGDAHSSVLTEPLLHYSHRTVASYLADMHRYTSLDAAEMIRTSRHRSGRPVTPSVFLPLYLASRQFIKLLVYRGGILDGLAGIVWCLLSAYYEFELGRKYLALRGRVQHVQS